jgi:hypothetical protein
MATACIGLSRARWAHGKDHVVVADRLHQFPLVGCSGCDLEPTWAVDDHIVVGGVLKEGGFFSFGQTLDVVLGNGVVPVDVPNHHAHDFLQPAQVLFVPFGLEFSASCHNP